MYRILNPLASKTVIIAICSFILFFCLFYLVVLAILRTVGKDTRAYFGRILVCEALLATSVIVSYCVKEHEGLTNYVTFNVSCFVEFCLGYLMWALFADYLLLTLRRVGVNTKLPRLHIWGLFGVMSVVLIFNEFFGFYYRIDENNFYSRGDFFYINQICGLALALTCLSFLIIYRKKIPFKQMLCLLCYIFLPCVGLALQLFIYGFPFLIIAMFIAIVIMFISMIWEETYSHYKSEEELLLANTKLVISQMHPHFLFNVLTSIAVLCDENPKEAKEATLDLSKYLRSNVDSISDSSLIPFNKELDSIMAYLRIEKRRFKDKLNFVFDLKDKDFLIPRFLVQPLVENSVKHGLFQKEGKGTIYLSSFRDENDFVHIIVEDDGVGFNSNEKSDNDHVSTGLKNSVRLTKNILKGEFIINSQINKGTKIEIKFKDRGEIRNDDRSTR